MKFHHTLSVAALLAVMSLATIAAAGPCKSAAEKYCKDVTKSKEMLACLKSHEADLSGDCKAHIGFFSIMPNCINEADTLCADEPPSESNFMRCLLGHQGDLSIECQSDLDKMR